MKEKLPWPVLVGVLFIGLLLWWYSFLNQKMVEIEEPKTRPSSKTILPASKFQVRFHSQFRPPFKAELNGKDITQSFGPCPSPSPDTLCAPGENLKKGNTLVVTGGSTLPSFIAILSDTSIFYVPELELSAPLTSTGGPGCVGPGCGPAVIMSLSKTPTINGTVKIPQSYGKALTATITPASITGITLNGQATGTAIQVTIPNNEISATFVIKALQTSTWPFGLVATAPGYAKSPEMKVSVHE